MRIKGFFNQFKIVIDDKYKDGFYRDTNLTNISRGRIIAYILLVIEIIVLTISLFFRDEGIFTIPSLYYYIMYLVFIITIVIFIFIINNIFNKKQYDSKKTQIVTYSFSAFLLVWNMGIALLDGNVMSYYIALIAVGVIALSNPAVLLKIYLGVHILFMALATRIASPEFSLFGVYINTTIALIISWFICFVIYKNRVTGFVNQKKIEEQNKEVNILNEKLTIANKKLDYLAKTDGLTGIYNRRMFDNMTQEYWDKCIKESVPLTVIMMDIDHFKPFNDNYGHQVGDDCLKKIVLSLKKSINKEEDMLARYGGEEFVAMIHNMPKDKAYTLAEKIRTSIEDLNIPHQHSDVAARVTLSLGVYSAIPTKDTTIDAFVKKADDALYKAKNGNRNKTIVA